MDSIIKDLKNLLSKVEYGDITKNDIETALEASILELESLEEE